MNFLFVVELVIVVAGAGWDSPMKLMFAGPLTACLDLVKKWRSGLTLFRFFRVER